MKRLVQSGFGALFCLFAALALPACETPLAVEPPLDVAADEALSSLEGLEKALAGAYDRIQGAYLYGGYYQMAGDLLAESFINNGPGNTVFEQNQMLNKQMTYINFITVVMWNESYYVINAVNNILAALPRLNDESSAAARTRIRGEALFLRAAMHFELNRYFGHPEAGLGIPYITDPTRSFSEAQEPVGRLSYEASYRRAIQDFEQAAALLAATSGDNAALPARASEWAARAYLARAHLYAGHYTEAARYADDVIEKGPFALAGSVAEVFDADAQTSETIFALRSSPRDNSSGTLNALYSVDFSAPFGLADAYAGRVARVAGDERAETLYTVRGGVTYTTKWNEPYQDVPILRLAEMYLTRAEARARTGDLEGARQDLNTIRNRSGLNDATPPDKQALLEAILGARTRELVAEGDYFHTLKRLERPIAGRPYSEIIDEMTFPIPKDEMRTNPAMVQNPGYRSR